MNLKFMIEAYSADTDEVLRIVDDLPAERMVRRITSEYNAILVRTNLMNWLRIRIRLSKLKRKDNIDTAIYIGTI